MNYVTSGLFVISVIAYVAGAVILGIIKAVMFFSGKSVFTPKKNARRFLGYGLAVIVVLALIRMLVVLV
ncbi:hypothetical protein [Paenibacillus flagellatus]|uniref:Uncharacterized protein n=1 Tax=Paenibacillus flagellatus TaxID=2211139 RepID=A0A2V5KY58_9BACL|nr:hypothetical protein [Paenibacillus flagellatus]PYI54806.1 hypothetical protein DLM86_09630 [Paenibacillus flagellatus]